MRRPRGFTDWKPQAATLEMLVPREIVTRMNLDIYRDVMVQEDVIRARLMEWLS